MVRTLPIFLCAVVGLLASPDPAWSQDAPKELPRPDGKPADHTKEASKNNFHVSSLAHSQRSLGTME